MICVPLFCQCVFVSLCLYVPVFLSLSFCLWPHVFVCLCLSLCCCVWGRLSAMESPDRAPIAAFICRPLLMSLLHPHYTAPNRPQITTKKRKLVPYQAAPFLGSIFPSKWILYIDRFAVHQSLIIKPPSLVPAFCKCMPGACSQLLRSIISLETDYCGEPPRLGAVAAQHNPALISN